jgi:DNA-directed RNA polymerase specialized sigma24 family protein
MDELGGIVESDPGELAMAGGMAVPALSPSPLPATGRARVPLRSAGGSRTEFGQFYADHYVALVRLATVLSGSADVAPDLVQDCFVGLHRHWITVRDPLPYVRRSVVHACASHHRRAARARGMHTPVPGNSELGADELEDAVAKLPPRQRAAVVLRFYGDLSDADIARALRCRPATVRSLVHRALADLRKVIEP